MTHRFAGKRLRPSERSIRSLKLSLVIFEIMLCTTEEMLPSKLGSYGLLVENLKHNVIKLFGMFVSSSSA